jgi:hypothetical protein
MTNNDLSSAHDTKFWQDRAAGARAKADAMRDATARETMRKVATIYERMARRAAAKDTKEA